MDSARNSTYRTVNAVAPAPDGALDTDQHEKRIPSITPVAPAPDGVMDAGLGPVVRKVDSAIHRIAIFSTVEKNA